MFNTNQSTTKTFNFAPSGDEFVLAAFGRCQVRPTELTQSHMMNARLALNFVLSEWSSQQPNLWEVGLQQIPLIPGVATYSLPASTVMILDLYISTGTNPVIDRYIMPISRTEYAAYPNKTQQGVPTVFWYNRLVSQTVTFWLVPDATSPYVAKFYSVRQTQDADVQNGFNVEIPYRFYEAYVAGVAWKLAEIYAPQLEDKLFTRYQRAYSIASGNDTENVPLMIIPGLSGYYPP